MGRTADGRGCGAAPLGHDQHRLSALMPARACVDGGAILREVEEPGEGVALPDPRRGAAMEESGAW